MHTEQDRIAFNKHLKAEQEKRKIQKWLAANPEIGSLNNGKFYKIVNGETVYITAP